MEFDEFKEKMIEQCNRIDIKINQGQVEKLYTYMKLMIEWNEKINLTAITESNQVITKHFIDSLCVLKYMDKNESIIDVGTGAGFPGIPIKIVEPDHEVMLLDSLNKRIKFLESIIDSIQMKNIYTVHLRAEDAGQSLLYREKYDVAVSRAVAPMNRLVEYLLPLVKNGGKCICMKGSNIEQELEGSKDIIIQLGGKIESIDKFELPNTDIQRSIIIIRKIKETPKIYPRTANKTRQN